MDFLKSAVASAISKGPPFPYTFGDRIDLNQSIWTLHNGTRREDGSNCSIFSFDISAQKSRLPLARNAVRKLKTLRHPGVIRVYESVETDTYIYVATERVTPLGWHLRRRSLTPETCKWGLFTVANTIKFINDEGASVHGSIRASSVFTSASGEWKLGGLDILSSIKEDDAIIFTNAGMLPDINRYAPPEVSKGGWDVVRRNPVTAVDAFGYGLLIFEVFNAGELGTGQPGQTTNIPPSMHQPYKRLLNANPKARLSVLHFLEQGKRSGSYFETPLIRLSEGVEQMGLKSDAEREELLSELDEVNDDFPEDFFKMKVLPELLKSVEFGGGGPKVFGFVMNIGDKLSDDDYESLLNPTLLRLFASPDRRMRVCMLDNLSRMLDHFPSKTVNDKIFPQLATGFTDTAPVIREQSVKAVLILINKLSDRTINGDLLKYLARTANDEQPGLRTNTTICLGKIARNLGQSTRSKVLIAAFSRSLRDPFVHARSAALQALAATADLFSEEDSATKILPAVCPSLIDKEKIVRDQANKAFEIFLQRIRKYGQSLPDTVLPPPTAANSTNAVPRIGTPQSDTTWAGWAISSFTNKLATASGEIQPKANGNGPVQPPMPSSAPVSPNLGSARAGFSASASTLHRQAMDNHMATQSASNSAANLVNVDDDNDAAANADDDEADFDSGWGTVDGDASFFDTMDNKAPAASSPTPFDDGGEPDFAGWLNAQTQGKSKGPLPKGLARTGAAASGKASIARARSQPPTTTAGATAKKPMPVRTTMGSNRAKKAPTPSGSANNTPTSSEINLKPKDTAGDDDWGDAWD